MKTNKHFINLFNFNFNLKNTFNKLFKKNHLLKKISNIILILKINNMFMYKHFKNENK